MIVRERNGDYKMITMRQFTWLGIILVNMGIWYAILTNGFFDTVVWVIIVSAIVGIIIKLRENR